MRRFLYSKWFFGFLAVVCILNLLADFLEHVRGWTSLNILAIVMDCIAVIMTLWMFADLHGRRPKHGGNSHSGR